MKDTIPCKPLIHNAPRFPCRARLEGPGVTGAVVRLYDYLTIFSREVHIDPWPALRHPSHGFSLTSRQGKL